ncbi:TetR/AcrR family transcriptional regulator [Shewanella intestini]|uniref:TetR/AcrR family transcriptional regulator n=1 Tax=Shewanella intestini TaxID=2017544 RepID=A0ABS5HZE5_9GAMM|nr:MULTISPECIES: TetR/AcrR family transcriptional regulator [Shewanella]MBR9726425.1 TetR/AcrR family transcriptional regulator [Shewanella intestini]MRG35009.1 TetR family transcriptional regulator [Shewanella sp. XMDDZSB0408]
MSKIDKRQAVLDAALSLFVANGFHATSTASIAKQAQVATGTLFHHFPTKDKILAALFLSIKTKFADDIHQQNFDGDNLKQDAQNLWQRAIDWALDHPLQQQFFVNFSMSADIPAQTRKVAMHDTLGFIVQLLTQGQQQGLIHDYPIDLMLENCHGQYLAAIRFFTDHPHKGDDPRYRQVSFELFWQAIATA